MAIWNAVKPSRRLKELRWNMLDELREAEERARAEAESKKVVEEIAAKKVADKIAPGQTTSGNGPAPKSASLKDIISNNSTGTGSASGKLGTGSTAHGGVVGAAGAVTGGAIGGVIDGFKVDFDSVPQIKAQLKAEQKAMAEIITQIEKIAADTQKAWESDFTASVQSDMKTYVKNVREKQQVLADNMQKHLDLIVDLTHKTEDIVKANADLFMN